MNNSLLLIIFFLLYLFYLIFCGLLSKKKNKSLNDYFVCGRNLSSNFFIIMVTATSFSGGLMLVFPSIIFRDGFQSSFICFIAIIIPLSGILFFKKQWILGKKFNYYSPADMYYNYFKSSTIKYVVIIIGLFFAIPFLSIQLLAVGKLLVFVSNNAWHLNYIIIIVAFVLFLHVSIGGLKSVAYGDILNLFLIWFGIIALGLFVLNLMGGFEEFKNGISKIALIKGTKWNITPQQNYSSLFAVPDIIQITKGIPKETPNGGIWTVAMIFSYVITFMGIQSSPIFSMMAYTPKTYDKFENKQLIFSSLGIGFALFIFIIIIGMGSNLLGANVVLNQSGIVKLKFLPEFISMLNDGSLILYLLKVVENFSGLLFVFLVISFLAAIQSSGSAFIFCGATMMTRIFYTKNNKDLNYENKQKKLTRIFSLLIIIFSLTLIIINKNLLFLLAGLSIALSFQLVVPLLAICYFPWLTKSGIKYGLIFGLITTLTTDNIGQIIFSEYVPWGTWPLTIYSGFWGIAINSLLAILISLFTQSSLEQKNRIKFHNVFNISKNKENLNKNYLFSSILFFIIWLFFSIGPALIIGNDIFGTPDEKNSWIFDIPSIWAWQIIFWLLGIASLWNLANSLKLFLYAK